jgi:hypothetical protein
MLAIVAALAIGIGLIATRLPLGRRRTVATIATTVALSIAIAAWMFTRDTNAITAFVAATVALLIWRTAIARTRWTIAPLALTCALAGFIVYSAGVASERNALVAQNGASWPRELSARASFPMIDNLLVRVLPDEAARDYFVDRGLPQVDDLMRFAGKPAQHAGPLFLSPSFAAARQWLGENGAGTYARWLLRHPLSRADEVVAHSWDILSPRDLASYMPTGWGDGEDPPVALLGELTTSETVLLCLLLATPFMLRHPRRHPISGIALCLVVSGIAGAAAAYYGDTIEITRHCYGSGQQIVLGLVLGLIGWLDRHPTASETPVESAPPRAA